MRSSPRRRVGAAILAAIVMVGIAGCGAEKESKSSGSKVLRVGELLDISNLDPYKGAAGHDVIKLWPMFDTLVNFDPTTLDPTPGLATKWEFEDPTTLRLDLREGVTFQDGTPFDAAAVKLNLDRAIGGKDPKITNTGDMFTLKSVVVRDPMTVVLHLKRPDQTIVRALTDRSGMMVSPQSIKAGTVETKPVGTGPYQFVERVPGDRLVTKRYDGYWGGTPKLDGITFKIIPNNSTRLNALKSGELDFAHQLRPADLADLKSNDDLEAIVNPTVAFYTLYLNPSLSPLHDINVRRAINLAIDRQALVDSEYTDGGGEAAYGFFPASTGLVPKGSPLESYYKYDLDEAKKLMAASKYPNGAKLEMSLVPDPDDQRRMEIVQSQLAKIGIDVELRPAEVAQNTTLFFVDKSVAAYHNQWGGRTDPAITLSLLFGSEGFYNVAGAEIPGFDKALAPAFTSPDPADQDAAIEAASIAVAKDGMNVPLMFSERVQAFTKRVTGYTPNLLNKPKFNDVSLSD